MRRIILPSYAIRYLIFTALVLHWYPLPKQLYCLGTDSITQNQILPDGKTMVSALGVFELGFFTPPGRLNNARYVGIWLKNFPEEKILWVANRENPVRDSSGSLMIGADGNLVILDAENNTFWSSNLTDLPSAARSASATLYDSGNLVLQSSPEEALWDSFSHPLDSILPGMKIGTNNLTGVRLTTNSWKNQSDPSEGDFVLTVEPQEVAQVFIMNGTTKHWRSGQWTGRSYIGIPGVSKDTGADINQLGKGTNVNFTFSSTNNMPNPPVIYLNYTGHIIYMEWSQEDKQWRKQKLALLDPCDLYDTCGSFGTCDSNNSPICKCLKGYVPRLPNEWSRGNWSSGCTRRTKYQCEGNTTATTTETKPDGFVELLGMKLPDFAHYSSANGISECRTICLQNCSCLACAYVDGLGCMLWGDNELIDLRDFPTGGGEALHIRLGYSELGGKTKLTTQTIVIIVVSVVIVLSGVVFIIFRWRRKGRGGINTLKDVIGQGGSSELPHFSLQMIEAATNKFSSTNKLGEGGFGPVYKGQLSDGQEIAVKRLSKSSGQGAQEFKNEVLLISKLQHRNLVKLLGFCIKGEERILVYEYMPNKSLDKLIFGSNEDVIPDWSLRYNIIEGIARGLLYLHRDSRLKIIHRDLKTSNILLDEHMNPKISDFGMARIFGGDESKANTNRIVGTYGYMSPEYAMQGIFSEKSDIFSFGVLLLEIVSSRKINSFYRSENFQTLLSYAWKLWNEGKAFELLDSRLNYTSDTTQITRCIQIGLLCVQQHVNDRPTMSMVVSMLSNDMDLLPSPNFPTFTSNNERLLESNSSLHTDSTCSKNGITMTSVGGR